MKSSTIYCRHEEQERDDRFVTVHASADLEMFRERIIPSTHSGMEIAGLLKKKKKKKKKRKNCDDDTNS